MSTDALLLDETFTITTIKADKYDRVARLAGTSTSSSSSTSHPTSSNNANTAATNGDAGTAAGDLALTLDVNTELYPVAAGDTVSLCLASTLALDGAKDDGRAWRDISRGESTLADHYDYVCHGRIYRFEEGDGEALKVFISFGGLLMYLEGPYKKLTSLRIEHVYLLMRKS